MSKITNDGWTQSGRGCFIAVPIWQQKWALNGCVCEYVVELNVTSTVDTAVTSVDSDSKDMDESTSGATSFGTSGATVHRDEYDWEHLSEPPDAGEIDQRNSDSSDFEETYIKRKTRRKDKKVTPPLQSFSCIVDSYSSGEQSYHVFWQHRSYGWQPWSDVSSFFGVRCQRVFVSDCVDCWVLMLAAWC